MTLRLPDYHDMQKRLRTAQLKVIKWGERCARLEADIQVLRSALKRISKCGCTTALPECPACLANTALDVTDKTEDGK